MDFQYCQPWGHILSLVGSPKSCPQITQFEYIVLSSARTMTGIAWELKFTCHPFLNSFYHPQVPHINIIMRACLFHVPNIMQLYHFSVHTLKSLVQALSISLLNKKVWNSPGQVAQLVGALSHTPKVCGFSSRSGHIPRLWVQSPVRAYRRGSQSTFLSYSFSLSLSLSLSLSVSLPPSPSSSLFPFLSL